jgi:hypothetical protein
LFLSRLAVACSGRFAICHWAADQVVGSSRYVLGRCADTDKFRGAVPSNSLGGLRWYPADPVASLTLPRTVSDLAIATFSDQLMQSIAISRASQISRMQNDFAGEPSDRCGARRDEGTSKSRDRRVTREDYNRATANLNQLAPPDLTTRRQRAHDAPAARRHDARSPHSSGS